MSGVLFAHYNKFLSTNDFQFIKSFEIIIMIVIGGMGSMTGAILGAVIVTLLPELLRQLPDIQVGATVFKFADLRLVIFALILILTMILRPQGILGTLRIRRIPQAFQPCATNRRRFEVMAENGNYILKTDKATIKFGGLTAVNELTMEVRQGEIYGLIGPNGAGKTTIFNLLTGVYEPTSGDIRIAGTRVNGLKPYQISRLGVSRTFQNISLFPSMSVLENVVTACHRHAKQSLVDAVFRLAAVFQGRKEHRDFALELLKIFDLDRYKDEGGTSLPYGNQRRLEIVRALATRPQLLFWMSRPPE